MRNARPGPALVAALVLLVAGTARADYDYRYVFDQSTYTANPSSSVDVRIFLQEVVTGNDTSRLLTDGLIGAGVRVRFDVGPVPGDPARVLGTADILPNTADFDDAFGPIVTLVPGFYAEFTEAVDVLSPPVLGVAVAPGTSRILLGTFRFTTGSSFGQVTTIQVLDIPGTSDTVTGAGLVLDPLIGSGTATIRVEAVPEPASLALLGLGLLAVMGRRLHHRMIR